MAVLETSQKLLLSPVHIHIHPLARLSLQSRLCMSVRHLVCASSYAVPAEPGGKPCLWRRACSHSSSTLRSAGASQEVSLAQALKAGRTRWSQPLGCLEELPLACQLTPHRLSSSPGLFWTSLPRVSLTMSLASRFQHVSGSESGGRLPPVFSQAVCIYSAILRSV